MKKGEIRNCPIVACTALTSSSEIDRCRASGIEEYIHKPLRIDELRIVLTKLNLYTNNNFDPSLIKSIKCGLKKKIENESDLC